MIVTLRTADGEAQAHSTDGGGDVIEQYVAALALIVEVRHVRAGKKEAGGGFVPHQISCDLMLHKSIKWHVAIERVDDPVTVLPGVFALGVVFKAVGVRVTRQIQPPLRPVLTVARRSEQFVHERFESRRTNDKCRTRAALIDERGDFFRRGRQADEIEGDAADQRGGICGRRCRLGEIIDALLAGRGLQRLEGPVFLVVRLDRPLVFDGIGGGADGDGACLINTQHHADEHTKDRTSTRQRSIRHSALVFRHSG